MIQIQLNTYSYFLNVYVDLQQRRKWGERGSGLTHNPRNLSVYLTPFISIIKIIEQGKRMYTIYAINNTVSQ